MKDERFTKSDFQKNRGELSRAKVQNLGKNPPWPGRRISHTTKTILPPEFHSQDKPGPMTPPPHTILNNPRPIPENCLTISIMQSNRFVRSNFQNKIPVNCLEGKKENIKRDWISRRIPFYV